MAITTRDGLVAALAGAANLNLQHALYKASISNAVSATHYSLWRGTGLPLQGATPSTANTPTNATTGAIPFTSPGSGNLYVGKMEVQCSVAGSIILYDRLGHMGGLSGTVLTPTTQTVGVSIPGSRLADADGANVEWFLEWYGDTGATASNCTVTYVDQTNTSRTAPAIAIGGTAVRASRLIPIVPNAGQTIKSVTSLVLSASTGTAGSFGVTCARRIATANMPVATMVTTLDPFNLGIPQIPTNACLWLVQLCSTTSTGVLTGGITLING